MSNKPLPENLISGYLDNQLSPTERADVESLLRDDPNLKSLLQRLKHQSQELADLPRYELESGFSNRLLRDSRVDEAFNQLQQPGSGKSERREAYSPSNGFGAAVAAIASLAALVLITLFIQLDDGPTTEVAEVALGVGLTGEDDDVAASRVTSKAGPENESLNDFAKAAPHDVDKSLGLETVGASADRPAFKGSKAVDESNQPQQAMPRQAASAVDAAVANRVGQNAIRQMVPMESESNRNSFEFEQGKLAEKKSDALKSDSDSPVAAGRDQLNNPVVQNQAVNEVVEIEFSTGSGRFKEIQEALRRNSITVISNPPQLSDQLAISDVNADSSISGGAGGIEAGSRSSTLENDEITDQPVDGQDKDRQSQAYLVMATPEQMAGLIADVEYKADVGSFRFSNNVFESTQDRSQATSQFEHDLVDEQSEQNRVEMQSNNQVGLGYAQRLRRQEISNDRKRLGPPTAATAKMDKDNDSIKPVEEKEKREQVNRLRGFFGDDSRPGRGSRQFLLIVRANESLDGDRTDRGSENAAPNSIPVTPKK